MNNNFPKVRLWVIVVIVIALFVIVGTTIGGRDGASAPENLVAKVARPFQTIFYKSTGAISSKLRPVRSIFSVYKENELLKQELLETRSELIKQTMLREEFEDLKKLRKAQNYIIRNSIPKNMTAEVISRDPSNFYSMFVINAGEDDGIVSNSVVFDGNGLIGQVYEAGDDWAKVLCVVDSKASVSFQILDSNRKFSGVVSGVGKDYLEGYFYDENAEAIVGDKIMTSGVGLYPRGIIVGTITEVNNDGKTLLPTLKVKPFVDFKKVNRVMVVPPFKVFEEKEDDEG